MAKWKVTPGIKDHNLTGGIEYDGHKGDSFWQVEQDETPYLEQAKLDRDQSKSLKKDTGYKKFATVPDIVAIEIKQKYGIDIHDNRVSTDKAEMAKFMLIFKRDYPHLMAY